VEGDARLAATVAAEQDDLLGVLPLVRDDELLADHVFGRLVDLLVEGLFLELRYRRDVGELDQADYLDAVDELVRECRRAGLLPLPFRRGAA
jgi:hypothetical protein